MSETWTPGPWYWEYGVSERTAWGLMGPNGYVLRFGAPQDIDVVPDPEADMALIALAPEMAELLLACGIALSAAAEDLDAGHPLGSRPLVVEVSWQCKVLLAKARGEDAPVPETTIQEARSVHGSQEPIGEEHAEDGQTETDA